MKIVISTHALDRWIKRHGRPVEDLQKILDALPESKVKAARGQMMRFKGVSMVIRDGVLVTVAPQ